MRRREPFGVLLRIFLHSLPCLPHRAVHQPFLDRAIPNVFQSTDQSYAALHKRSFPWHVPIQDGRRVVQSHLSVRADDRDVAIIVMCPYPLQAQMESICDGEKFDFDIVDLHPNWPVACWGRSMKCAHRRNSAIRPDLKGLPSCRASSTIS